jgi:hypothetical protein
MDESSAPDLRYYLVGVRLLAVQLPNPDEACEFYKSQFELEVVGKDGDGTIRLSDGTVTLLLTRAQVRPKKGVQYFGIQVKDLARPQTATAGRWRDGLGEYRWPNSVQRPGRKPCRRFGTGV